MLIYPHMPTYATVFDFHEQKSDGLFQITSNMKSCLRQTLTQTNAQPDQIATHPWKIQHL